MIAERLDLVELAVDFGRVDADLTAARAQMRLIAETTIRLNDIAGEGPLTDELATSIEATVQRFGAAIERPALVQVSALEHGPRIARALRAGESAYELARQRAMAIVENWERPLMALAAALAAERDRITPLLGRFAVAAGEAGIDLGEPDQIELTRRFGRWLLGQPLTGPLLAAAEGAAHG